MRRERVFSPAMRNPRKTTALAVALAVAAAGSMVAPRLLDAQTPPPGGSVAQGADRGPLPATPPAQRMPSAGPTSQPSGAASVQVPTLEIERYTLPNGLEVILHQDRRTPTVSVNIWYHVGSKDEPQGRNGFAHLFEHLMFQGSRHVPEDTFFLYLERAGGSGINGTTGDDRTNYFETVPSGRLNLALWLESDRMAFLLDHVDQATFESQRNVVLNEYRQNYENAPYGMVYRYIREAIYPATHPYHRLPIGTPEDLNAATLEDVRQFFRTWYVPNNATLVIAGYFDPAEARSLVDQYFGPIVRGADVPRRPAPEPVVLEREMRLDVEAGVELPRVYIAYPTPAFFRPGDAELDLLGAVLTNGRNSRLYRRLVHQMRIAQDVNASQGSQMLGSIFMITATAQPGHAPEELLRAIDEELASLRQTAPEAGELERARTRFVTDVVFDTERVSARADRINLYNQYVGDPNYLAQDVARYQRATAEGLMNTVRTYLPPDRRVVLFVHPTPGAPIAGRLRRVAAAAPAPNAPAPSAPANASAGGQ